MLYKIRKFFRRWGWLGAAYGMGNAAWQVYVLLAGNVILAGLIASASTTWQWYWETFSWAGLGIAFLVSFISLAIGWLAISSAVWLWNKRREPKPTPALAIAPLPQAPSPQIIKRPLSTYEAEQKAKALDALISLIRDELRPLVREAEQYPSHGPLVFRNKNRLDDFDATTARLLETSNLLRRKVGEMLRNAEVYDDISEATKSFPQDQSIDSAIGNYNKTFTDLLLWLKDEAPRDVFQRLIGPRDVVIGETTRHLTEWLNQAEQNLVRLRRGLAG